MVESVNHGALEILLCFKFPFGFVSDIEFMKEKQRGTLEKLEHANIWHFCWKTRNYKKWMQIKAKNNEQHMGNLFSCYKALISFGHLTSVKKNKAERGKRANTTTSASRDEMKEVHQEQLHCAFCFLISWFLLLPFPLLLHFALLLECLVPQHYSPILPFVLFFYKMCCPWIVLNSSVFCQWGNKGYIRCIQK